MTLAGVSAGLSDSDSLPPGDLRQTSVIGNLAFIAVTLAAGRWMTGPTFGYAIFALVWTPIAAILVASGRRVVARSVAIDIVIGLMASVPFWFDEGPAAAGRMTAVLLTATAALSAVGRWVGRIRPVAAVARPVAVILWLTAVMLPLVRSSLIQSAAGDGGLDWTLRFNPFLALNAASATAGDWTHQAVAYRRLTRLGQDFAFDWPSVGAVCAWYAAIAAGAIGIDAITAHRPKMFHVEQSNSI